MEQQETLPLWEDNFLPQNNYHMVNVTEKVATVRKAEATGIIRMSPLAFRMVRDKKLPKGDALALAEVAGLLAVKQTPQLLPLCHPLPIEEVKVSCELFESSSSIRVRCEVSTTAKTGVEMEALMGTNGALLCLYDLIKMVEPALVLESIHLNYKLGGKNGHWKHPEMVPESQAKENDPFLFGIPTAVVTASDRAFRQGSVDVSGPVVKSWLASKGAAEIEERLVPDVKTDIQAVMNYYAEKKFPLIIITGGTGMGPRDVTFPALLEMGVREMKGFGELFRSEGSLQKKSAWLSNSGGFILGDSLILALPGSPRAVKECLDTVSDLLPHALHILKGGNHA